MRRHGLPLTLLLPALVLALSACGGKTGEVTESHVYDLFDDLNAICSNPTDAAFDQLITQDFMLIDEALESGEYAPGRPVKEAEPEDLYYEDAEDEEKENIERIDLKKSLLLDKCDPAREFFSYDINEIVISHQDTTYVNMRFRETPTSENPDNCKEIIPPGEARVSVIYREGGQVRDESIFYLRSGRQGLQIFGIRRYCND